MLVTILSKRLRSTQFLNGFMKIHLSVIVCSLVLGLSPTQMMAASPEQIMSEHTYSDDIRPSIKDYAGEYLVVRFHDGGPPDYPYDATSLVLKIRGKKITGTYSQRKHKSSENDLIQNGVLENVKIIQNRFEASALLAGAKIHKAGRFVIQYPGPNSNEKKGPTPRGLLIDNVFYERLDSQ